MLLASSLTIHKRSYILKRVNIYVYHLNQKQKLYKTRGAAGHFISDKTRTVSVWNGLKMAHFTPML